jgi:hypothetical protein
MMPIESSSIVDEVVAHQPDDGDSYIAFVWS